MKWRRRSLPEAVAANSTVRRRAASNSFRRSSSGQRECGPQGLRRGEWLRHTAEVLKKLLVGERGLLRRVERLVQSSHESCQNSLLDQRHVLQILRHRPPVRRGAILELRGRQAFDSATNQVAGFSQACHHDFAFIRCDHRSILAGHGIRGGKHTRFAARGEAPPGETVPGDVADFETGMLLVGKLGRITSEFRMGLRRTPLP